MRITRTTIVLAVLALLVATASVVAAAAACHGPFYTNWGSWDQATETCSGVVFNQCEVEETILITKLIVSGTSCRVKYNCCIDPV